MLNLPIFEFKRTIVCSANLKMTKIIANFNMNYHYSHTYQVSQWSKTRKNQIESEITNHFAFSSPLKVLFETLKISQTKMLKTQIFLFTDSNCIGIIQEGKVWLKSTLTQGCKKHGTVVTVVLRKFSIMQEDQKKIYV